MKKFLTVMGVGFLVVIVLFGVLLVWAQKSGAKHQEKFFRAVLSGDTAKVMVMLDAELKAQVDEPVLAEWMKLVTDTLGDYKGLSKANFSTSKTIQNGATVIKSKGTVRFTKGSAESQLTLRAGLLTGFFVTWENFPKDWLKRLPDTALYRRRGTEFLTLFLQNKPDETFRMMHASLQHQMPAEKLKALMAGITAKAGTLNSVTFDSENLAPEPGGARLKTVYKVACEKASTAAVVEFKFMGMKGHLLAFDLTGKPE